MDMGPYESEKQGRVTKEYFRQEKTGNFRSWGRKQNSTGFVKIKVRAKKSRHRAKI
jgi:hypothetical protein